MGGKRAVEEDVPGGEIVKRVHGGLKYKLLYIIKPKRVKGVIVEKAGEGKCRDHMKVSLVCYNRHWT